jgi:hypothetical protein
MGDDEPTKKCARRNTARTNKMRTKLLQGIAKGMNVSEAGREAGYSHAQSAHLALKGIRMQMQDIVERMDLPIEKVLKAVLVPGLEAERIEFFTNSGVVMETRKVVDHEQRGKYLDRYCKLLGLYGNGHESGNGDEGVRVPHVSVQVVINRTGGAERTVEVRPSGAADHQQLDLDATTHEDEGRPGPDPEL